MRPPLIIYQIIVTKAGAPIFTHEIALEKGRSFSDDVRDALETFRKNFPQINLMDDDVSLSIARKPE